MFIILIAVTLVERNPAPNGIPLLDSKAVAKHSSPEDLVMLAQEIQKVFFYNNYYLI